ncbi:hypothetical protein ACFL13_01730 [Patescibacteria group bacterium]
MLSKWQNWIPVVLGVFIIGGVIFSFWYQAELKVTEVPVNSSAQKPCVIGKQKSDICVEEGDPMETAEEEVPGFWCYKDTGAKCERQKNGKCGWTMNEELEKCLEEALE